MSSLITRFFFVDNVCFITSGSSIQEMVKAFEKVAKEVVKWEILNAVTYDISKTEAVFYLDSISNA